MNNTFECPKCHGTGELNFYRHIAGGICFQCKGEGRVAYINTKKFIEPHQELLVSSDLRATSDQWSELETLCTTPYGVSSDAFCLLVETKAGGNACLKYLTSAAAEKAIKIGRSPAWQTIMRKRWAAHCGKAA